MGMRMCRECREWRSQVTAVTFACACGLQQPLALADQPLPQGGAALGEGALGRDVLLLALRGLDPHRLEPQLAEVVRRSPHVELPDVPRQLEAVGDQLGLHQRGEAEGVLVQVHPRVQAARLLERGPVVAAGLQGVQGAGGVGEEPEGVEVRARDLVVLDHLVGAWAAQPERPVVPDLLGPVHHRPLMQPETAQVRRTARGRDQQPMDRLDDRTLGQQVVGRDTQSRTAGVPGARHGRRPVALLLGVLRGVEQPHPPTRVPPAEGCRALGVVAEEEVVDRVLGADAPSRQVWLDPCVHPLGVRGGAGQPGAARDDFHSTDASAWVPTCGR